MRSIVKKCGLELEVEAFVTGGGAFSKGKPPKVFYPVRIEKDSLDKHSLNRKAFTFRFPIMKKQKMEYSKLDS
jgi:hypothetical protein